MREFFPAPAEGEPDAAESRGPAHRAGEIEEQEAQVTHPEHPGEDPGENPEAGDEASEEDRQVAVPEEQSLGAGKLAGEERQALGILFDKGCASKASQAIAQAVANRGPEDGRADGTVEPQPALIGQESRKDQDSFARDRQARVLEHDAEEDRPVPVMREEPGEELKERFSHRPAHYAVSKRPMASRTNTGRRGGGATGSGSPGVTYHGPPSVLN